MSRNSGCTVYIGNLDDKVSERVLYEILIQAGRLVDLHIPCDKESNRRKGFAFAEYESEEIANYAVRLFSGVVRLYNKTLKFGMSGQYKSTPTTASPVTPSQNIKPILPSQHLVQSLTSCRSHSAHSNYSQASPGNGSINLPVSPYGSGSNGSIYPTASTHGSGSNGSIYPTASPHGSGSNGNIYPTASPHGSGSNGSIYSTASPHGSGSNGLIYPTAYLHGSVSSASIPSSCEYTRRTFGQTMNTIQVQNSRY